LADTVRRGTDLVSTYTHPELLPTIRLFENPPGTRATYKSGVISVGHDSPASSVAHETTHATEQQNPEVLAAAKAFLKRRTRGETPQLLSKLMSDPSYGPHEVALEDEFAKRGGSHYCGKVAPNHTEILTEGIVRLHLDPYNFWRQDPDYFFFVVKTLRKW
jgi:hypothetical protein